MVFSSISFLFYFLPLVLFIYFISPRRIRSLVLTLASLFFYAWGEPRYVIIMLISTVLDYTCGRMIAKNGHKGWLVLSIVGNLSILGFFKYYNFLAGEVLSIFGLTAPVISVPLPIGISFYTFQTMSYTIDVYRKRVTAQKNIIDFAAFVTLFPQLIAGPIVRYADIERELCDKKRESIDSFSEGAARFVAGLGKKVLLANNIGLLWEQMSTLTVAEMSVLGAWLGAIAFAFQIYFDFSGYSDMAIGLGKMFGFNFPENFNFPYISRSITEFWRRWHMSLSTWFRDYVYVPLGGNRCGTILNIRNILIVWLLTGFWHGASWNFILWGVYYGILLLVEKFILKDALSRIPRVLQHIYTLFLVLIGWVIFAFDDLTLGLNYLRMMFGSVPIVSSETLFAFVTNLPLLVIVTVGATPLLSKLKEKRVSKVLLPIAAIIVLLLSTAYLVASGYNPFLYFRF